MWLPQFTSTVLNRFRRLGLAAGGVHPPSQTARLLERERERTDRTRQPLSVILFRFLADTDLLSQERTASAVRDGLRSLDEVGWLQEGILCALLPATPAVGATQAGEKLLAGLTRLPVPELTIYTYFGGPDRGGPDPADLPEELRPLFFRPLPLWKRGTDIAVSLAGLVLLAPLFALLAALVKASGPGPVFFRQRRSGLGGQVFWMLKFRSMNPGAERQRQALADANEQDGPAFKMKNDPRVTRLGRFLRTTSLDELPQLWNVLKGDMSLVGPRPLPCEETDACLPWQKRRLDVTPGLTCIWQVRGRGDVSFADWIRMDKEYIRGISLWQDLKLLVLTIPAVLARRGAH